MKFQRSLTTLRRVCWTGMLNFGRNAWLSVAATAVMFVCLTVVLGGVVLHVILNNTIKTYAEQFTVAIYLKDTAPQERVDELKRDLESQEFIERVVYISKDEALSRFKERFSDNQAILEGFSVVGGNSLPASFDVVLSDVQRSGDVQPVAENNNYPEDVVRQVDVGKTSKNNKDAERTVQFVANAQRNITRGSIAAALIFAGISILIIFNTIRMAIYTRQDEIKIMKLIGATPGYIRGPFLFESALYGILAGTLAYGVVSAALVTAGKNDRLFSQGALQEALAMYQNNWLFILLAIIGVGVIIGIVSSMLAMEKHLKLKHW